VIQNAVHWCAPRREIKLLEFGKREDGWMEKKKE